MLKEDVYLHDFATLEEAREVIGKFIECYSHAWLRERHSYRTPGRCQPSADALTA